MTTRTATLQDAETFGVGSGEFEYIQKILGRSPNLLELELFSILWAEHASYKHSLKHLQELPRSGQQVVVEAGREVSGAVDIGDGEVCVFKVESHNHPCAVQPRLGAATGLRVVARDVFALGARPLAFLNALRFGDARRDTARWLFEEVIEGLADFEKGFGLPLAGGDTFFAEGFNSSPVVNNMVVGVASREELLYAVARGEGNIVAVVGAATGSEGIDGDAFAADVISDHGTKGAEVEGLRNMDVEKSLMKLLQKLSKQQLLVGVQPVGAQGLAGAMADMAARGQSGLEVRTDAVPLRDAGLSPRDILVAETWGRLLLCFEPSKLEKIKSLSTKAGLEFGVLGKVTNTGLLCIRNEEEDLARIPVAYLGLGGKAPVYEPEFRIDPKRGLNARVEDFPEPDHYPAVVRRMMSSPNLASKKWLGSRFTKSLKSDNPSSRFPSDAAIIPVGKEGKALVATMDGNPGYMNGDIQKGAEIAVAEAVRNIVCAGGQPLAVSDCLNFGNPRDPEAYGHFVASVRGVATACKYYNLPVISGNVSFYNQRSVEGRLLPVTPSPLIGMVGLLKHADRHTTLAFRQKGDMIFLVGRSRDDVNGSEYLRLIHSVENSIAPCYSPEEEKELHQVVSGLIDQNLVRSVHDVSNGGLYFTLLESSLPLGFGFDITSDAEIRKDAFLFGEAQSRVVVSVAPEKQDLFVDFMVEQEFPFSILGHVTKGELRIDDESFGFMDEEKKRFEDSLKNWLGGKTEV